jgi:hypothetical protein
MTVAVGKTIATSKVINRVPSLGYSISLVAGSTNLSLANDAEISVTSPGTSAMTKLKESIWNPNITFGGQVTLYVEFRNDRTDNTWYTTWELRKNDTVVLGSWTVTNTGTYFAKSIALNVSDLKSGDKLQAWGGKTYTTFYLYARNFRLMYDKVLVDGNEIVLGSAVS